MNSTTHATCNALRNCNPRSHDELMTLVAVIESAIKQSQILSSKATSVVLDMLSCEIIGQIEQDKIEQQQETAWYLREDVPQCAGTWASLDALTVWSSALSQISGRPA